MAISSCRNLLKDFSGEIFGFSGRMGLENHHHQMVTVFAPTSGKVLRGEDLWKQGREGRRLIGFVPDNPLVYERLTAREHLMVSRFMFAGEDSRRTEELCQPLV